MKQLEKLRQEQNPGLFQQEQPALHLPLPVPLEPLPVEEENHRVIIIDI